MTLKPAAGLLKYQCRTENRGQRPRPEDGYIIRVRSEVGDYRRRGSVRNVEQ